MLNVRRGLRGLSALSGRVHDCTSCNESYSRAHKRVSAENADSVAKAIGVPPALLVRLSIDEHLRADGLNYKVEIKPAA